MLGCFGGFVIPQQVFWSWIQECLRYAVARSFSKFRKVNVQSFFFPEETENVSWKKDISDSYRLNIQSRTHSPFPPQTPPPPPPPPPSPPPGGQEQMRYPLLGTKLFFMQILRKKIIVLSTSMVALLPGSKLKIPSKWYNKFSRAQYTDQVTLRFTSFCWPTVTRMSAVVSAMKKDRLISSTHIFCRCHL